MQSRGGASGMSGGHVNYGATELRNNPPPQRANPFDDDDDTRPVPIGRSQAPPNFRTLRVSIVDDIASINSCANALEKSKKIILSDKDSPELRKKIHESEQSTNKCINRVAESLKQLSTMCSAPSSNRNERIECQRLMGEFRSITQRYNDNQKQLAEKARQGAQRPVSSLQPATATLVNWNDEEVLVDPRQQQQQQHQQQQFQEVGDVDLQLLQEREADIRQLETDIIDINQIFRDLGALVYVQGEMIDTIEDNVEQAHSNVEEGVVQLRKASDYQRSARKKKCCLLTILLVVVGVIILIIVLSVKLKG